MQNLQLISLLGLSISAMAGASAPALNDTIHPVAEEALGGLVVHEPFWGSPEEKAAFPYTLSFRGVKVQPGTRARFKEGTGCLALGSTFFSQDLKTCGIPIHARQDTRFKLSGLVLSWQNAEDGPLAVDFGQMPRIGVWHGKDKVNASELGPWSGTAKQGLAILPGTYRFDWGVRILEPTERTVAPGDVLRLDLTPPDRRARLVIEAPERTFPDPEWGRCENPQRLFLVERGKRLSDGLHEPHPSDVKSKSLTGLSRERGIASFQSVPLTQSLSYRVFPFPREEKAAHYELVVNNQAQDLDLEPGAKLELAVKRIDVDDVLVVREGGEQIFVKGEYSVFRRTAADSWEPLKVVEAQGAKCEGAMKLSRQSFPTKTGLDVLPGYYKVVVSFTTESGPQTREYELDFTN
jgi:hypothetical protein